MDQLQLETLCKQLRLPHLPKVVDTQSFETKEEWLLFLLKHEVACREELKTARLFKQANFPTRRTLETYEWHDQILLPNPSTKEALISLSFIRQKENAVFIGTPGTGKTHLASALGQVATKEGIETRFWRVSDLVIELECQWKNNSLEHFKRRFDKVKLIILDELCEAFHNSSYEKLNIM